MSLLENIRANVPPILIAQPRWIRWRLETELSTGKERKKPVGSTRDASLPKSLDEVGDAPEPGGLGFITTGKVLLPDGTYAVCLDVDACRDPATGSVAGWAVEVWRNLGQSYTEITPSGSGLHIWNAVEREPVSFSKIRPGANALPEGSGKKPEIQGFGCGPAGYVTMTGDRFPGSLPGLAKIKSLDWLFQRYRVEERDDVDVKLPVGNGVAPAAANVLKAVEKAPSGRLLLEGRWEELDGYPSASEAWLALVRHGLAAANGHAEPVIEALQSSAWGRGDIDSIDPDKYASERWVKRDVARIASKLGALEVNAADVFDVVEMKEAPAPVKKPGALLTAREFCDSARTEMFLVHQMLPRVGVAQLFGEPGSGKTPVAMSLAVAIATGVEEWLGHEVDAHGPVLYFVGEGGSGLANRLVAQLGGEDPSEGLPIYFTDRPGQLMDAEDVAFWVQTVREKFVDVAEERTPRVIVVDTQSRNWGAGDENSSQDANTFIDNCKALARIFDCLVLLVHHSGHLNKNRARGSSVFGGALDACYEVVRTGKEVKLVTRKAKDWGDSAQHAGTLLVKDVGRDRKGRVVTAVCFDDSAAPVSTSIFDDNPRDELLELLTTLNAVGRGVRVTERELCTVTGEKRTTLRRKIDRLKEMKLLEVEKFNDGTTYKTTESGLSVLARTGHLTEQEEIDELLS